LPRTGGKWGQLGERGEVGPGPPEGKKDKQSVLRKEEATWSRKKKAGQVEREDKGPA
jgi:hypothetical protein